MIRITSIFLAVVLYAFAPYRHTEAQTSTIAVVGAPTPQIERCVPAHPPFLPDRLPEVYSPRREPLSPGSRKWHPSNETLPTAPVLKLLPEYDPALNTARVAPERLPTPIPDTSRNTTAIREKLERLRQLLETNEAARKAAAQVINESPTEPPELVSPEPEDIPPTPSDAVAESPAVPEIAVRAEEPHVVMTSPVNRLKLADNLFGAGRNDVALQAYTLIDIEPMTEVDQAWVQFQIASCHRRLGKTSEAEKHYRIVASYKNGGVTIDAARWWLDRLHAKQELTVALSRLTTIVGSMEESKDAN